MFSQPSTRTKILPGILIALLVALSVFLYVRKKENTAGDKNLKVNEIEKGQKNAIPPIEKGNANLDQIEGMITVMDGGYFILKNNEDKEISFYSPYRLDVAPGKELHSLAVGTKVKVEYDTKTMIPFSVEISNN